MFTILSQLNFFAVIVTAIIFFIFGSLWFSFLFKDMWQKELKNNDVAIKTPTSKELITKMLLTFVCNILASFAMAILVKMTNSNTFISGLYLGKLCAMGFAFTAIASLFIWENKSLKLFLIDVGYPAIGIIISAILLSVWH